MKKILFCGMILILLFSWVNASELKVEESEILVRAFEESGADLLEANISTTLHLPNKFFTMGEMEAIQKNLMGELELRGEVKFVENQEYYDPYFIMEGLVEEASVYVNKNRDTGYNQISICAIEPDGEMKILILYSAEIENHKESYIIINYVKNKGYKNIGEILVQQKKVLNNFGENIETTTTLVGTSKGILSQGDRKIWVNSIIDSVKGKKIEEVMDDNYTSTTLYIKEIPSTLEYNGKRINLQVATRYNTYENKTYLWIATPLITNTY